MPILTEYSRENESPPEPIGYQPDEHDPNDDRHDPDGLEELKGAEPHSA